MKSEDYGWVKLDSHEQVDSTTTWFYRQEDNLLREESVHRVSGKRVAREWEYTDVDSITELTETAKLQLLELSGDYRTVCPVCGGDIHLVEFRGFTDIPVQRDGWDYSTEGIDSEDEVFRCTGDCGAYVPSEFVHNAIPEAEAKQMMINSAKAKAGKCR